MNGSAASTHEVVEKLVGLDGHAALELLDAHRARRGDLVLLNLFGRSCRGAAARQGRLGREQLVVLERVLGQQAAAAVRVQRTCRQLRAQERLRQPEESSRRETKAAEAVERTAGRRRSRCQLRGAPAREAGSRSFNHGS